LRRGQQQERREQDDSGTLEHRQENDSE